MTSLPRGFGYQFSQEGVPLLWKDRAQVENTSRNEVNPIAFDEELYEITALSKYKLFVNPNDESVGKNLYNDGYWEIWITQFLSRHIQKGWRILDIGANFGYYTMMFADFAGPDGYVLAVEPNAYLRSLIQSSALRNGFDNVLTAQLAISDFQGEGTLSYDPTHLGDASIKYKAGEYTSRVAVTTIDSLTQNQRIDLIKIDIEGAEPEALYGAERTLTENEDIAVCVEWVPSRYESPRDVLEYIQKLGFHMLTIAASGTIAYQRSIDELLNGKDWEMLYLVRNI